MAVALLSLSPFLTACPKDELRQPNARVSTEQRSQKPATGLVSFNGERAMDHVRKQIDIGPRISGSPELEKTREYIISFLNNLGLRVTTDEFVVSTPIGQKPMVNLTAEIPGESKDVVIIASHYETKYFKDMRFVGANDPAASVGTLMEMARVMTASENKPKLTYWLVFFDGEEAFCRDWDECSKPGAPDNTYGSRRYVAGLKHKQELARVRALVLLDLMGYTKLELGRDTLSTRWLQDIIWETGRGLGYEKVFVQRGEAIGSDDHEPFLEAGVDSVDLIQLNSYPYWHRADDTIDKVSARSMKIVGDTVLASLPRIEAYLLKRK